MPTSFMLYSRLEQGQYTTNAWKKYHNPDIGRCSEISHISFEILKLDRRWKVHFVLEDSHNCSTCTPTRILPFADMMQITGGKHDQIFRTMLSKYKRCFALKNRSPSTFKSLTKTSLRISYALSTQSSIVTDAKRRYWASVSWPASIQVYTYLVNVVPNANKEDEKLSYTTSK